MSATDDALLAELLDGMLSQRRENSAGSLEDLIAAHPHLARELRELWATVQIAEEFASFDSLATQDAAAPEPASPFTPREFGDYELLEELGRGGMGIVYRARQKSLDRIVALKMILRGDLASAADLARFRAEAEAAARLHHPNIVPVYEVDEIEGRPCFSMKLIEGTTLARKLLDGPLASRTAAEMLVPICRAIADAHRRGVLHRDLKPSNILIDHEGRTYVTDFGLAKRVRSDVDSARHDVAQSLTQSGAILGTPSYMAPEQAAGHRGEVNAASDIYSLGAILYATLTGRPPFQAETAVDTVLMVLEQDAVPPRMLNPRVDSDLEMIALKCLQKPQDLRYASADALADDLDAYLANEPISARSSHLSQIITRAFRETHHAAVLENWGLLWMWHSLVVFSLCLVTNYMQWRHVSDRWPYAALWGVGVGTWAMIFWELRRRSGPITFVERQIAHFWAASSFSSMLLFGVEALLELRVLTLSPVLPLIAGNVFLSKAGVLSGKFYVQAIALYVTSFVMALITRLPMPDIGLSVFGFVLALAFFLPGLKYYRLLHKNKGPA